MTLPSEGRRINALDRVGGRFALASRCCCYSRVGLRGPLSAIIIVVETGK
jgi:hypothetical protein